MFDVSSNLPRLAHPLHAKGGIRLTSEGSALPVTVTALGRDNLQDLEDFFQDENGAFSNNPFARRCYCVFHYRDDAHEDWRVRGAAQNRTLRRSLVEGGRGHGVLAYHAGRVVGWAGLDLRPALLRYGQWGTPNDADVGIVHCFVVNPSFRRRGVATALLACGVVQLGVLGARAVEAYVVTDPAAAADNPLDVDRMAYHGPLSMFLAQGFTVVDDPIFTGFYTRVRRVLA